MFGRTFLTNNQILPTRASFDNHPTYKHGGVTLDWSTVQTAGGSGSNTVSLPDGSTIYDNVKYLRYGQVITYINATGKYGPYDPTALDGRATLTRGQCFIVDETVTQYQTGTPNNSLVNDQFGGVFDQGTVWFQRLVQSGTNSSTIPAGPTLANFNAAFPAITYAGSQRIVP